MNILQEEKGSAVVYSDFAAIVATLLDDIHEFSEIANKNNRSVEG